MVEPSEELDRPGGGRLNAAIARAVVHTHRTYAGRGPTRARAFFRRNVVVVVMEELMTRAEQSLANDGQNEALLDARRQIQQAMQPQLVEAVEVLTGCKVTAFMGDNHLDPDMAVEVFVLDQPVPSAAPSPLGQ